MPDREQAVLESAHSPRDRRTDDRVRALDIGVVSSRGIDSQLDREICYLHTVFGIAADEFVEQSGVGDRLGQ